jgi:predicted transcriptional regulator
MDKVISARIDADVADLLDRVTKRFRRTKKEFLESAIRREAEAQESEVARRLEIIERTAGALGAERGDELMREIAAARQREDKRFRELWEGPLPE